MFDRPMTVERLLAHSMIFDEAARLHRKHVASELRQLAEDCAQVALAMVSEVKFDAKI